MAPSQQMHMIFDYIRVAQDIEMQKHKNNVFAAAFIYGKHLDQLSQFAFSVGSQGL